MENFGELSESSAWAWEGFSDAGIDEFELDSGTNNGSNASTESAPMNLEPPPETEYYDTYQQLLAAVNNWALKQGYAITSKRTLKSKRGKGELYKIYLQCDRGGRQKDRSNGIRSCASRRIDCPFDAVAKKDADLWSLKIRDPEHNHPPFLSALAHPVHRKMDKETRNKVRNLSRQPIKPREITTYIRLNAPDQRLTRRDVYNERVRLRREQLGKYTPTQALLHEFQRRGITHTPLFETSPTVGEQNIDQRLCGLFFTFPWCEKMWASHPEVLLIDAAYKTNRFRMPLVQFTGVSNLHTNFNIGFCFINSEDENAYVWTIQRLSDLISARGGQPPQVIVTNNEDGLKNACDIVFPEAQQILCTWHIDKNVLGRARKTWITNDSEEDEKTAQEFMGHWRNVARSKTLVEFRDNWAILEGQYAEQVELINYLKAEYLPLRHQWVDFWADQAINYGTR
jgi:hypothetical protein